MEAAPSGKGEDVSGNGASSLQDLLFGDLKLAGVKNHQRGFGSMRRIRVDAGAQATTACIGIVIIISSIPSTRYRIRIEYSVRPFAPYRSLPSCCIAGCHACVSDRGKGSADSAVGETAGKAACGTGLGFSLIAVSLPFLFQSPQRMGRRDRVMGSPAWVRGTG